MDNIEMHLISEEEEFFLECVDECLSEGGTQAEHESHPEEERDTSKEPSSQPSTSNSSSPTTPSHNSDRSDYNEYMSPTPSPPAVASTSKQVEPPVIAQSPRQQMDESDSLLSFTRSLDKHQTWKRSARKDPAEETSAPAIRQSPSSSKLLSSASSKDTYSPSSSSSSGTSSHARRKSRATITYHVKRKDDHRNGNRRSREDSGSYKNRSGRTSGRKSFDGKSRRSKSPYSPKYDSKRSRDSQPRHLYTRRHSMTKTSGPSRHQPIRYRRSLSPEQKEKEKTTSHLLVSPKMSAVLLQVGLEQKNVLEQSWREPDHGQPPLFHYEQAHLQPPINQQSWRLTPGYRGSTPPGYIHRGPSPSQHRYPAQQQRGYAHQAHPFHPVSPAQMSNAHLRPRTSSFWKSGTTGKKVPSYAAASISLPHTPSDQQSTIVQASLKASEHNSNTEQSTGEEQNQSQKLRSAEKEPEDKPKSAIQESQCPAQPKEKDSEPAHQEPKSAAEQPKQAEKESEQLKAVVEEPKSLGECPKPTEENLQVGKKEKASAKPTDNMDPQEAKKAVHELFSSSSISVGMGEEEQVRKKSRDYLEVLKKQFPDLGVIAVQAEDSDMREMIASSSSSRIQDKIHNDAHEQDPMLSTIQLVASPVPPSPAGLFIAEEEEEDSQPIKPTTSSPVMTTTSSISASTEQTAQVEQAVESTSRTAQDNLATKTSMSVIEEAQPGSKARPPEGCLPSSDALPCAPVSVIHSDLSAETPVVSEPPPPPPVKFNSPQRKSSKKKSLGGTARIDPRVRKTSLETPTVAIKVEPREEDDSLRPSGSSTVSTGVRAPLAEVNRPDAAQKQASSHKQQPRPHSTSSSEQSHRRADKCKTASSTSKDLQSKPDDLKVKFKSLGPSSAPASKSPKESRQPCSSSSNTIQTSSLNSLQFPDMQRDHPSVIAKPKIPIRIGNQASSTPPAVNSLTDTVFTVGPSHPDGEVIQPALADIALPDPPQPPVYLRNAPFFSSEQQQQRTTQEEELQGAANMDISDGEEELHKISKKAAVPCAVPAPQSAIPPQSPGQYMDIQSPRISESSTSSSRSNRPLGPGQQPRTRETSHEAIENRIRNQLKSKMQAEFEAQFNAMKANYKGQIDQFIKQIMHLENTLQKKEQAARQDQDNGNMPRINALLAEKAKLEGIIDRLRTTISDNQTLSDSLQAKHADQLMAKEQEMRERENDAFTRYVTEQNKARKLKEDLQKLQERMKDLQQSSDTSTTLEDENRRLKDELDKTVTELEQSKADAASMQTVLEEAQMQLETDKCMLRHAEEEFDKKMDQVNRQKQLDKQEIAVWKEKHDSLEARLSVPQKSVQTMTTFTLATEDHLIKCVDETMEMKWKLTQTCQDYKQKMVALKNANEENKATKSELEGVTNDLKLAVKEVVSLKAQLEDSQIKLEEERNQATAITMQMFEMEQKLNVEKICVGMQTDVVVAPVVVEQSAPPLDPVLSRPSSISLTPQTTQNNHTSSNRKRSHGVSETAQKQNALPATPVANESDDEIIFEKMVKPTKKMRTKSNPKISVRDILSGPSPSITPSLDKVPKRDMSEISSSALEEREVNILQEAESSSSPSVRLVIGQNNTEEAAKITSPDSTLSVSSPMGAVPQVFAHNAPGGQPNKTATHSTVGFQLPLHVQTSGSSARASPSSYSDASTVSPSTYHQQQNSASLRAGSKQAKYPMLSQTLSQPAGHRYNSAGFRVETSRGVVPAPVDPFLAQSQQSTLMTSNPMQNPELHSRFVQLFDQHQGQQTQSMPPTLQQQQPLIPMTYGQQQAQPSQSNNISPNPQSLKVIAEANRVLEAFFAFLLVNATHQPACCVLIPFCNSYNIPEKERAGLLAQLEPLAFLFDQMKVENLAALRNRHRSSGNKNV